MLFWPNDCVMVTSAVPLLCYASSLVLVTSLALWSPAQMCVYVCKGIDRVCAGGREGVPGCRLLSASLLVGKGVECITRHCSSAEGRGIGVWYVWSMGVIWAICRFSSPLSRILSSLAPLYCIHFCTGIRRGHAPQRQQFFSTPVIAYAALETYANR